MTAVPVLPDHPFVLPDAEVREAVRTYGTPLYVLDEATLRARIRRYRSAFNAAWPRNELTYASKANSTLAVLAIADQEGCFIDVASEGELRAALGAGVPASRCHLHGNSKLESELRFALEVGVREIVVDHVGELDLIADLIAEGTCPTLLLRLAPGVDPVTHAKISTGQSDTKFGFSIQNGDAARALAHGIHRGLPIVGVHAHVGSQLLDPEAQRAAGEVLAEFAIEMLEAHGWEIRVLNVGGGLGVRYTDADRPMPVEAYCQLVAKAVQTALAGTGLDPILVQEPGRSLVAEAGVTLYQVGAIKTAPRADGGSRTYIAVDGGLSDNPRPGLYGARYSVRWTAADSAGEQIVTISGRHCETDTLFPDIAAPLNLISGDVAQVLSTGAYNASMASNYNRFPRPATILRRIDGSMSLIQARESWDELFVRERLPEDFSLGEAQ